MRFEVRPASPQYLLQSPDAHRTAFPDVLKTYNGFETWLPSIDLEPLMELRIENAYYEPGVPRSGLAGFLGTEVAHYSIHPAGLHLLSAQSMKNRPENDAPVEELISQKATGFNHYRLYYEIIFARENHSPRENQSHGSVLLGANSQAEIDALSARLSHPESVCSQQTLHCTVFPEACSVSVEMGVVVNRKPTSILWGSTLGSIAKEPHHLEMKRLFRGALRPVRINPNDPRSLLLPLLPGDQIAWN